MPPEAAREFLDATLAQDWRRNETAMFAAVQMARMTGDRARDLPDEARAQVLERFVRLPGTKVEGTGLGLPIAREIAVRHRSELVLDDGIAHENGSGCGLRASVLFATDFLLTFCVQVVVPDTASQPVEEAAGPE